MIRIALSSIITAAAVYAIHAAAYTTPYITIVMLMFSGLAAGALTMFAVLNDSEVK